MSAELVLTETFAGHEYLAPPAHELLPLINAGFRRRRRLRAVGGAFAAVAVVAAGGVVAGGVLHGSPSAARPGTQSGGTSSGTRTGAAAPRPADLVVTVAPGWLPAGSREIARGVVYGFQSRAYVAGKVYITVGTGAVDAAKIGRGSPTTINGHPATEWNQQGYELQFRLPSGAVGRVGVTGASRAAARQIGLRVATTTREGQRLAVAPVDFTVAATPSRAVLRGISRADGRGTVYTYSPAATSGPVPAAAQLQVSATRGGQPRAGQTWWDPDGHRTRAATAGRPVLGHPTVVATWTGGVSLWVTGLVPRTTIVLTGGNQVTTLDELYRIAAGIRPAR
jgi:hypothetical protein